VVKYRVEGSTSPSQTWKTFLAKSLKPAGCIIVTDEPHNVGDPFSSMMISINSNDLALTQALLMTTVMMLFDGQVFKVLMRPLPPLAIVRHNDWKSPFHDAHS
jgi:hypothetical protein